MTAISKEQMRRLRELARRFRGEATTKLQIQDEYDLPLVEEINESFNALESVNMVPAPFGPVVTDWHYPMYPASLITNLRNAPYPYSQAYASRIQEPISHTSSLFRDHKLPKFLYCGIEPQDRKRLATDGIRVGTPLYTSPNKLQSHSTIVRVKITPEIGKRIRREKDAWYSLAYLPVENYKVIHDNKKRTT